MARARAHPPRLSQTERRQRSERKLIESALSITAESGVSAATFEAIGQRAGYSRGLASQKFGSKEGLLRSVINHLHDARNRALEVQKIEQKDGLQALLTYVDIHFTSMADNEMQAYFLLLAAAVADLTAMRALFAESHERSRQQLESMFIRGRADGSVRRNIDGAAAAVMVGSLLVGVSIQYLADPAMDLESVAKETRSVLRASFAASAAR